MKKKGEVERKNREKMAGGRNKKKKIERGKCWVWFGEEERVNVKKKEKRKKERKKLNLIKEERETN